MLVGVACLCVQRWEGNGCLLRALAGVGPLWWIGHKGEAETPPRGMQLRDLDAMRAPGLPRWFAESRGWPIRRTSVSTGFASSNDGERRLIRPRWAHNRRMQETSDPFPRISRPLDDGTIATVAGPAK